MIRMHGANAGIEAAHLQDLMLDRSGDEGRIVGHANDFKTLSPPLSRCAAAVRRSACDGARDAEGAAARDLTWRSMAHFADERSRSGDRVTAEDRQGCPASRGAAKAINRPSFATCTGSKPGNSQAAATSSQTGIAASSSAMAQPEVPAISTAALARPPRVRSRRQRTAIQPR